MKILFFLLVFGSLGTAQNLTDHAWKKRVVTIHSDASEKELAMLQLERFVSLQKEMKDRAMVLYFCEGASCTFYDFFNTPTTSPITAQEQSLEIRLYGLDGQLKYEANQLMSPQELFAIIDAMPMRRNEMRKKIEKEGYE